MRIWKYELKLDDCQEIEMPVASQLLTVQAQHGKPMLWALVDDAPGGGQDTAEDRYPRYWPPVHG